MKKNFTLTVFYRICAALANTRLTCNNSFSFQPFKLNLERWASLRVRVKLHECDKKQTEHFFLHNGLWQTCQNRRLPEFNSPVSPAHVQIAQHTRNELKPIDWYLNIFLLMPPQALQEPPKGVSKQTLISAALPGTPAERCNLSSLTSNAYAGYCHSWCLSCSDIMRSL